MPSSRVGCGSYCNPRENWCRGIPFYSRYRDPHAHHYSVCLDISRPACFGQTSVKAGQNSDRDLGNSVESDDPGSVVPDDQHHDANATLPNRYVLLSRYSGGFGCACPIHVHRMPRANIPMPNVRMLGPNKVVSRAPSPAPRIVPMNRRSETVTGAPRVDCITIRVVTAAQ